MARFPVRTHDQKAVLGVAIGFSILAALAVTLRLTAHAIAHKRWTASDYLIIAACIFAIGLQSVSITGVLQAGIGYGHVTDIVVEYGLEPLTKLSQLIVPLQFLWVLSLSCTKASILFLYLKIFPLRWIQWTSYATLALIVAWTIGTILAGCLICRPFAYNWDKSIPGGTCGDQVTSFTITGIINLVTDAIVLGLPMYPFYKLQMAAFKKIVLILVFGLGIVTCIISALRISVLSSMDFADISYTIPKANIFSGLEPCLAVVLASVPMMWPLLGRAGTSIDNSNSNSNSNSRRTPASLGFKKAGGSSNRSKTPGEDDASARWDDDTNRLWLRPVGLEHRADAAAAAREDAGYVERDSLESLDHREGRRAAGGGIKVKQSFDVTTRDMA